MPTLLVCSAQPLEGKTTLVTGLARLWAGRQGIAVRAVRLHAGDPHQEGPLRDARHYSLLPSAREPLPGPLDLERAKALGASYADGLLLVEGAEGLSAQEAASAFGGLGARVLWAARYQPGLDLESLRAASTALGEALAGVVVTAVPQRRRDEVAAALAATGLPSLGLLPEDALLASFTVAQVQEALAAEALVEGDFDQVVERVVIGPVSTDPGREYFARFPRMAVITRSHKPDLQLAALDVGTVCLIVAGGKPPLEYVTGRAEEEGVPVLLTAKSTAEAARALEGIYGWARFQGRAKVERASELVAECLDYNKLSLALGVGAGPRG